MSPIDAIAASAMANDKILGCAEADDYRVIFLNRYLCWVEFDKVLMEQHTLYTITDRLEILDVGNNRHMFSLVWKYATKTKLYETIPSGIAEEEIMLFSKMYLK